jgi:UDP-N-acetylglucosamine 4,6-dehydratase
MAPGTATHEVGIRPGEKLHETMISIDDSRTTYDLGDRYVIESELELPIPTIKERFGDKSSLVKNEFAYTSDANTEWMDVETLRVEIEKKLKENKADK